MNDQLIAMSYELSEIRHQQLATNTKHQISVAPPSGGRGFLFIDTDMYVMKVWCEFVFNKCHNWILNQIATRHYDAYLLCDVDLPWIEDKLREYPDIKMREKLYHFYKDLMIHQSVPWCIISGDKEERLNKAISFIESSIH
jgi:nicotinamide riboside kinase